MKRVIVFFLSLHLFLLSNLKADEGMWLLPLIQQLNISDMQDLGFELTAEDIYSINNSSLKDAIVIFGGGCTAEIVSEDGLLFTNHHCGYDQIQNHSTIEHDYLSDGFWAMSKDEELPNPDLQVKFLRHIEHITDSVLVDVDEDNSLEDQKKSIQERITHLEEVNSEDGNYEVVIRSFYEGNEYYMFIYEVYKDVRLVGTPPSSIGKFGFDSDNWEWPRHTGDFSIFRVYTSPDGSPAEYDKDNIPLKPGYFLPVSRDGVQKGDFTFVMGYPGTTNRYMSSYGIEETMEIVNKIRIDVRGVRQEILMEDMLADPKVNIMYASKYSRSSNYWKYSIGQNRGLRTLKVIDKKRKEEKDFQKWVELDSARNAKYGMVLQEIAKTYEEKESAEFNFQYLSEAFFRATELIDYMSEFQYLYMLLLMEEDNKEDIENEVSMLKDITEEFFKEYNLSTDVKVAKAMFKLYQDRVPAEFHPTIYEKINGKQKGNIDKFIDKLYDKTFFTSKEKVLEFLDSPNLSAITKDIGFLTMNSIFQTYYAEYIVLDSYELEHNENERLYMEARMIKKPDTKYYPDANFTLRLTYGIVDDYSPRDAVHFDYMTFLSGVMEKEDSSNFEFVVSKKLKQLFESKNYGEYGISDRLPVCFITTNDITGGNSGSPVLNARGELIGLAFDGNWEAMSGDIAFEQNLQRCICVDIRYVLFIIEKYAGAGHLIEELKLVN